MTKYKIIGTDQDGNTVEEEIETSPEYEALTKAMGPNPTKEQRMQLLAQGIKDKTGLPVSLIGVKR